MPLTFSHPAAVVPLARCGLLLSPLIVGSMAPDFPYFLQLSTGSMYGHTLPGLFFFCLPAGYLALWVFHTILERPLLSLLPVGHRRRLAELAGRFRFGPMRRFLMILVSLLVGALTHIAWDSITHAEGWVVRHVPVLRSPVLTSSHETIRVYKFLQHGSTLGGAALLVCWYLRWYRSAPAGSISAFPELSSAARRSLILLPISMPFLIALVFGWHHVGSGPALESLHRCLGRAVLVGVAFGIVEIMAYSLWWHWRMAGKSIS